MADSRTSFFQATGNSLISPQLTMRSASSTNFETMSFSDTKSMSLVDTRSRSFGNITARFPKVDPSRMQILKLRRQSDLDRLVEVLVQAAPNMRAEDLRHFRQPYNPHRAKMASRFIDEEKRRKQVLQVLRKYPICDIYDLARCDEHQWNKISRDLGGLGHGVAMRRVFEAVSEVLSPLERASFWAAVGQRQRLVDHGRTCGFAAMDGFDVRMSFST